MTSSSLGPAGESIATELATWIFASATYALPGPTIRSTRGTLAVPYASAAIAPAPPSAKTRSAFASAAAASTTLAGRPEDRSGGEQTTTSPTPTTRAGTTPMNTLLGYAARPPGAYTPTRPSGSGRRPTMMPGSLSTSCAAGRKAACTRRIFSADRSIARRSDGSSASSALVQR